MADHVFLPPTPGAIANLGDSACVVGWSFGAWRLLFAGAAGLPLPPKVLLLAPFVGFCAEHGLGGRCAQTQLRFLRRWLARDPESALADFHTRAGLSSGLKGIPYPVEDLQEGLKCLESSPSQALLTFASQGLAKEWHAVVGGLDPLLDGVEVCRSLPGCKLAPEADHRFETLIQSAGEFIRAI